MDGFARIGWIGLTLFCAPIAWAAPPTLPYTTRTQGYSAYSTTIHGDISTIGMAGATVGTADSFISAGDNPAALAMTRDGFQLQITGNSIQDGDLQSYSEAMRTLNLGVAFSHYPYNLSLGVWSPQSEGQDYLLQGSGDRVNATVHTREYRATLSRTFNHDRLSVGASLILGQNVQSLDFETPSQNDPSHTGYQLGAAIGAMYKLPQRALVGVSFTTPMMYDVNPSQNPSVGINDFFQTAKSPWRIGMGLGWIPNRFFKAGSSLYLIGSNSDIALLSNDNQRVGQSITFQPRWGASYIMAEYKYFKAEVSAGTYWEISRIEGTSNRLHATAGLDLNIWIFNLGWGVDEAARYHNVLFSAGIDVIRMARSLDFIPPECRPPYGGFLPPPFRVSDEGLPRPLIRDPGNRCKNEDLFETARRLPERMKKKLDQTMDMMDMSEKTNAPQPAPNKKPAKPQATRNNSKR